MPFAGVIFDCDGTLADSEPLALAAWEAALGRYGYKLTPEDFEAVTGFGYPHVHGYFASRSRIPAADELWPEVAAVYYALVETRLVPFDDAVGLARTLRAAGVPLAVASSSFRERLDRTLGTLGLAELFPVTVAGDEVAASKPAPDLFLAAAAGLGVDPTDCLAIEDSGPGVTAALAAGMRTVAVRRAGHASRLLDAAHLVVDTLTVEALATVGRDPRQAPEPERAGPPPGP